MAYASQGGNEWTKYKDQGNVHFRNKNFAAAIKEFDEAIKLNSKEAVLFSNRAACHQAMGNFELARGDGEKVGN